ncbi:MAG: protease SohB [Pseudomonadales bacterium]
MEFLNEYGLFLAKTITLVIAFVVVAGLVVAMNSKGRGHERGHIEVYSLNDGLNAVTRTLKQVVLAEADFKKEAKNEKKQAKQKKKSTEGERKSRVFVVDFEGDVQASAVDQLREEITAILAIAEPQDEVVVRLESPGGMVHSYGLAASQLSRIVGKDVKLTIAVDKVAASGGYMMACLANHLIAAPFALLGSIGVVAQIPNFNRFLKGKEIDVEVLTAGEYKRTLTMLGENTEKGREKFLQELEDVHALFKEFVKEHRPVVDTDVVATGEAWYGKRALEHKLVDALQTSDEYIIDCCQRADVYRVKYVEDKNRVDKIMDRFAEAAAKAMGSKLPYGQHLGEGARVNDDVVLAQDLRKRF